jgi:hypothetical protein
MITGFAPPKGSGFAQLQPPTGGLIVHCRSHFLSGAQRQAMGLLLVGTDRIAFDILAVQPRQLGDDA